MVVIQCSCVGLQWTARELERTVRDEDHGFSFRATLGFSHIDVKASQCFFTANRSSFVELPTKAAIAHSDICRHFADGGWLKGVKLLWCLPKLLA